MATAQINQKMHDIAEARWKMLPIAVQREHEILGLYRKSDLACTHVLSFHGLIFSDGYFRASMACETGKTRTNKG